MKLQFLAVLLALATLSIGCPRNVGERENAHEDNSAPYDSVSDPPVDETGVYVVTVPPIPGAIEPPPKPESWHWVNVARSPPPTLDATPSHLSDLCTFLAQNGFDFGSCGSSLGYSVSVRSDLAVAAMNKIEAERLANRERWNRLDFRNRTEVAQDSLKQPE